MPSDSRTRSTPSWMRMGEHSKRERRQHIKEELAPNPNRRFMPCSVQLRKVAAGGSPVGLISCKEVPKVGLLPEIAYSPPFTGKGGSEIARGDFPPTGDHAGRACPAVRHP